MAAALEHFKGFRVRRIEIEEWTLADGSPVVIYAEPMNLTDKEFLFNAQNEKGQGEALIRLMIRKARDESGQNLFTLEDLPALRKNVDPDLIAYIGAKIAEAPSIAELEKN